MSIIQPHQVPEPPESRKWVEALRWLVAVMDDDDSSLAFVAGVLSYALKNDGLITQAQAESAQDVLNRVVRAHRSGRLECQKQPPSVETVKPSIYSSAWEPWISTLDLHPESADLLRAVALSMDQDGLAAISQARLAELAELLPSECRDQIAFLERRGILSVDRSAVPHRYSFASIREGAR